MKIELDEVLEIIDEEIDRISRIDTNLGVGDIGSSIIAPLRNIKREIRNLAKGEEDER